MGQIGHDEIGDVDDVVDGIQADRFEALLEPKRGRLDGDVFKTEGGEAGAELGISDGDGNGSGAGGEVGGKGAKGATGDGGDLACHAVVAPEVGAMGERFVVDLNDRVGGATGDRIAGVADGKFDDTFVLGADAEFLGGSEHARAVDSAELRVGDAELARGNIGGQKIRAAVGGSADDLLDAVAASVDRGDGEMGAGDRLGGQHARDYDVIEVSAVGFDAFALGGFDGDEAAEFGRGQIEAVNVLSEPGGGELHRVLKTA